MLRALGLALALVVLTGCASTRGVAEFAAYRAAYAEAQSTGEAILDRLAVAERALHARANPFDPAFGAFAPDEAPYLVEAVDPPSTAAFRRAIRAVGAYTDALAALSNGETAEAMAGRLGRLGALGIEAAGAVGATPPAAAVNAAVGALAPFAEGGLALAARAQFRDRLLENADAMAAILSQTRDATAPIFAALAQKLRDDVFADPSGREFSPAEIDELRSLRRLMAHWVVLLDASRAALASAVAAAGSTDAVGVAGVLAASETLAVTARGARRALAGGAP
ncbi:MAG: hypothetical protein ACFCUS_15360 [Rubrimonas sp.]